MNKTKLALVATLVLGAFSSASAISFEEAIKNVDFTGQLRYRYDSSPDGWGQVVPGKLATEEGGPSGGTHSISEKAKQNHRYRIRLGAKADIADRFKVFGQVQYGNDWNGGYTSQYYPNIATNNGPFKLRLAYMQYDASDYGLDIALGKQELRTIWTSDMAGMAAKTTYSGLEGITLVAFAVDNFEADGDRINPATYGYYNTNPDNTMVYDKNSNPALTNYNTFWNKNFYGAAAISNFDLGGSNLNAQVWFAYFDKRATFWATDLSYSLDINEDMKYTLQGDYFGNSVANYLQNRGWDNNSLFALKGSLMAYGFDMSLGGFTYGKKKKFATSTIEDIGQLKTLAGKELYYMNGSKITNSFGQNTFAYVIAGYTLPQNIRIGAQYVMGGTKSGILATQGSNPLGGGKKNEIVGEVSYQYNQKLGFLFYYSKLSYEQDTKEGVQNKESKDSIRFQALYNF